MKFVFHVGYNMCALIDITGQHFGRWEVLERDLNYNGKDIKWLCKCKCGNIKSVSGRNLKNGTSQSCGCLMKQINSIRMTQKMTNPYERQKIKELGQRGRKHFGCMLCGSDNHYAKGYCKNCYYKKMRGTL